MEFARTLAILVAAGRSSRMGGETRKPFLDLDGRPVLLHAVQALAEAPSIASIVVVVHPADVTRARALLGGSERPHAVAAVVAGGAERVDSVRAGVLASGASAEQILVHDGARPLVTAEAVEAVVAAARAHGAALLALPISDTVKRSSDGRFAESTVDRSTLWTAQTPQAFEARRFRELLERAEREGFRPTDDAALWERYVGPVAIVPGSAANLKITEAEDLQRARSLLGARRGARGDL